MNPAPDAVAPGVQPARAPGLHLLEAARVLRVGGALLVQASLHGQLARVEWAAEKVRLSQMLGWVLLAHACALCAMLGAAALAVALSWDSAYRTAVLVAVPVSFAAAGGVAWLRLRALSALGAQAFAATREELAADLAVIRSGL